MIQTTTDRVFSVKGTCYVHNESKGVIITSKGEAYGKLKVTKPGEKTEGMVFEGELLASSSSTGYGQETGKVYFSDTEYPEAYYSMNTDDLFDIMFSDDFKMLGNGKIWLKFIVFNRGGTMFIRPYSRNLIEQEKAYQDEQDKKAAKKTTQTDKYEKGTILKVGNDEEMSIYLGYGKVKVTFTIETSDYSSWTRKRTESYDSVEVEGYIYMEKGWGEYLRLNRSLKKKAKGTIIEGDTSIQDKMQNKFDLYICGSLDQAVDKAIEAKYPGRNGHSIRMKEVDKTSLDNLI